MPPWLRPLRHNKITSKLTYSKRSKQANLVREYFNSVTLTVFCVCDHNQYTQVDEDHGCVKTTMNLES